MTCTKPLVSFFYVVCVKLIGIAVFRDYIFAGNKAPSTVQAKKLYIFKDLMRIKNYYQLPLNFPNVCVNSY